jgi:hypothetical protein
MKNSLKVIIVTCVLGLVVGLASAQCDPGIYCTSDCEYPSNYRDITGGWATSGNKCEADNLTALWITVWTSSYCADGHIGFNIYPAWENGTTPCYEINQVIDNTYYDAICPSKEIIERDVVTTDCACAINVTDIYYPCTNSTFDWSGFNFSDSFFTGYTTTTTTLSSTTTTLYIPGSPCVGSNAVSGCAAISGLSECDDSWTVDVFMKTLQCYWDVNSGCVMYPEHDCTLPTTTTMTTISSTTTTYPLAQCVGVFYVGAMGCSGIVPQSNCTNTYVQYGQQYYQCHYPGGCTVSPPHECYLTTTTLPSTLCNAKGQILSFSTAGIGLFILAVVIGGILMMLSGGSLDLGMIIPFIVIGLVGVYIISRIGAC